MHIDETTLVNGLSKIRKKGLLFVPKTVSLLSIGFVVGANIAMPAITAMGSRVRGGLTQLFC